MSCPDWKTLQARRDDAPREWDAAVEHLDACDRCRDEALAAEPTLLFRRLPGLAVGSAEVEDMKRAVAGMRRQQRVAARRPAPWLRAAALAAVLAGAAMLEGAAGVDAPPESALAELPAATVSAASGLPASVPTASVPTASTWSERATTFSTASLAAEQMPLVELVDPSSDPYVEVVDDQVSLLVVFVSSDV